MDAAQALLLSCVVVVVGRVNGNHVQAMAL
jgi:hypothetical protein